MAENRNAQQVREITDKLEQGLKELFESERFKEYLKTMSKFYNYSFNNTLLIAMQKPDATLIAGYTAWQRNFDRHVMKGEKGIKILAPAPYKVQEEREKLDPATQKPVLDKDGKPVTETVEVTRPAFKERLRCVPDGRQRASRYCRRRADRQRGKLRRLF